MLNLLLIEDNAGDARLIREMLRDTFVGDVEITCAENLADGLEIGTRQNQHFDAVLLDLSLPDSMGLDSVRVASENMSNTPIIVLTGNDSSEIGVNALQSGAQDYLIKGETTADILKRAIRYSIERHQVEARLRHSEAEYRSLIEDVFRNSDISIFILDSNFKIVWVNEATELYFGMTRDEMIGQSKRELADVRMKCMFTDADGYIAHLFNVYDQNTFSERFECHIFKDETHQDRWLEYWSQPIHGGIYAGGRIEHYMDITHRKNIEAAEAEQRQFAEALRDTLVLLTNTLNLNEVLNRILENIGRVVPHDSASIILLEGETAMLVRSIDDKSGIQSENKAFNFRDVPVLRKIVETGEPINTRLTNVDWHEGASHALHQRMNVAYIGIPIFVQEQILGILSIFNAQSRYTTQSLDRLQTFAGYAAIAIQNAQLFRQSQDLATVEERQRLARELHDSVTQTLFSASVLAETAVRQRQAQPERVALLIEQLHTLTTGALAEMRVLLLELRPANLEKVSFEDLLIQLIKSIKGRKVMEIELNFNEGIPPLEADTKIALYRITQEALNNIVKHSSASKAKINVFISRSSLTLTIVDNGTGFEPQVVGTNSLGLSIMRERAAEIGATLEIHTLPDEGTSIKVQYPYSLN